MTPRVAPQPRGLSPEPGLVSRLATARGTAVASVWIAALVISALSPDLVAGPGQRHLPVAAATTWVWALLTTGFLRFPSGSHLPRHTVAVVVGAWTFAALLAVTAPNVTASHDSTRIPVMAEVAPALAALVTGYALIEWLASARPAGGAR